MTIEPESITLKGKVVPGPMRPEFTYIQDERGFSSYPEIHVLGLKWQHGDEVEITIRRIPKLAE
jgi:hypothetical protein